jgi:hypothetical protein
VLTLIEHLLSWRLRRIRKRKLREQGLPDLPELRKVFALAWWADFSGSRAGLDQARADAYDAVARHDEYLERRR